MKNETKDRAINIIVKDSEILKRLTKEYYDVETQGEQEERLLGAMSRTRCDIDAKLDLMLDLDIITVDEWVIMHRMVFD